MIATIAELPFHERPVLELLNLADDRAEPDPDYVGYGWARTSRVWLVQAGERPRSVDDALLLALHCPDDGVVLTNDIELYFEIPNQPPVTVLASKFFDRWCPRLPKDVSAIVLALCNPFRASLSQLQLGRPLHFAHGEVESWIDRHDGRIELRASSGWRHPKNARHPRSSGVPMSIQFGRRPGTAIDDDAKQSYVGLWLLKKIDLKIEDGGMVLPVALPPELTPLDEPLQQLAVEDLIAINRKRGCYDLTKKGIAYLGEVIDEASDLVDELDELETDEAIADLRARGRDVFRARYLWGWFDGEFDDLVLWQERRGARPIERLWAFYLTGDALWNELARELAAGGGDAR